MDIVFPICKQDPDSAVTILLALITLYIGNESLNFAQSDENSDKKWKSEQIELLKENNIELKRVVNELSNLDINIKSDTIK